MKKKLIISTETFPYGKGEKTFVIPELERLVKSYDITIVSHASPELMQDVESFSQLNAEVELVNISLSLNLLKRIKYGFQYLLDLDGWSEIVQILRNKEKIISRIYQSIGFYALAQENYKYLKRKKVIPEKEEAIYYTFWFYYYTYSMTKRRKKYKNIKIISRTHGFDLYNERYTGGRQPFKRIMTEKIDRLVFISEAGKKYYENTYGCGNAKKYIVNRLGTKMRSRKELKAEGQAFRIVSCSSVIPLKRINYIIDALQILQNEKIEWIHFGEGSDYESILQYAKECLEEKENIYYEFKGFVPNEKIVEYYESEPIDCFITTSSTEGIPVSIQEAMSVGIPVIGTAVGGIPEMIDGNGILLSADPDSQEIAEAICRIYYSTSQEKNVLREQSLALWRKYFWDERNVNEFIQILNTM